jgi:hypothetical protein
VNPGPHSPAGGGFRSPEPGVRPGGFGPSRPVEGRFGGVPANPGAANRPAFNPGAANRPAAPPRPEAVVRPEAPRPVQAAQAARPGPDRAAPARPAEPRGNPREQRQ